MSSRYEDYRYWHDDKMPDLPSVDFAKLGYDAPQLLDTRGEGGNLPQADIVVVTWTSAEWSAMEQVFVHNKHEMPYSDRTKSTWDDWIKYDKDLPPHDGKENSDWTFWGYYRMVKIGDKRVLLYKSNTHITYPKAQPPGSVYLPTMVDRIVEEVQPELFMSIGTAGGCRLQDHLGTVNVVNGTAWYEKGHPQSDWPVYTTCFTPEWSIIDNPVFKELLYKIPTDWRYDDHGETRLQRLADSFIEKHKYQGLGGKELTFDQLNALDLDYPNDKPEINNLTQKSDHRPLLTASSFLVGTTSGEYDDFAVIDMDDAIIAKGCQLKGVDYCGCRNVSDPAQNDKLDNSIQSSWGSQVYETFGMYTSYNGALAAWAILQATYG